MAEIRFAPTALSDLNEIKQYISETLCNPSAAARTVTKILDDCSLLKTAPLMGASLSRIISVETDYRYLISGNGNYIVFYKANEAFVSIYRVLYSRRDYIKILFG